MLRATARGPENAPRKYALRVCKFPGCEVEIQAPWLYCREHSREMIAVRKLAWRDHCRERKLEKDETAVQAVTVNLAEFPPIVAEPGFCKRCGVIRLSRVNVTGICDECHSDIQARLNRIMRKNEKETE